MRVLFAAFRDASTAGGSLRVAQTLATGLRELGVDAHLAFAYGDQGPVAALGTVPCHYLGVRGSSDVQRWGRFDAACRSLDPHIVHFIDPSIWMHAVALPRSFRKVLHVHGVLFRESGSLRDRLAWRFAAACADLCVCITEGVRASVVRHRLARESRTTVIYNGVDFDGLQIRPSRAEARDELRLPRDAKVIGMVCRLVPNRACDDLLRLVALLDRPWHGLLVGDGPARPELEARADSLGIGHRVTFTGSLSDTRPAYAAMDGFAMLALYDSFGLATAEAMASRVPVFGLAGDGEYREPQNPLVTPDNAVFLERVLRRNYTDLEDRELLSRLAIRIDAALADPDSIQPMIDRAWHHVKARFTQRIQSEAMLAAYRGLLEGEAAGVDAVPDKPALVGRDS